VSGSRLNPVDGPLAEQHLGDRLSALVDGELGHEARERVLAHLATCAKCKSEADEQRRLKNVFAEVAPRPLPRASWPDSRGSPEEVTRTATARDWAGERSGRPESST